MTDEEIARRLRFIRSFVTTERASVNRIIRVEADVVVIAAESTGHERSVSFADIRKGRPRTKVRLTRCDRFWDWIEGADLKPNRYLVEETLG
jgi:hypothetical protein